jgi:prepilin-type N-terminal cleavage/methylation domain-containing protein/prepilin-type processing-associated H-X9-DG protein
MVLDRTPFRSQRHDGFTLIELLVVIAIIGILAGIAMPIYSSVQESGRSTRCASNLRQIGAALDLYCNDNNNNFPPIAKTTTTNWDSYYINPYLPERTVGGARQSTLFICPDAKYSGDTNTDLSRTYTTTDVMAGAVSPYTNTSISRMHVTSFAKTIVLFDATQSGTNRYSLVNVNWGEMQSAPEMKPNATTSAYIDFRHNNAFHGLFLDGHVESITRASTPTYVTQQMWSGNY